MSHSSTAQEPQYELPGRDTPAQPVLLTEPRDVSLSAELPDPPLRWREPISLSLLVLLADYTIYRGAGFAGYSLLFLVTPLLLMFGVARHRADGSVWFLAPMLFVLAARLLWCGSALTLAAGFATLVCCAMSLSGHRPYVPEALLFAAQTVVAGFRGLALYIRSLGTVLPGLPRRNWMAVLLPLVALVVFSLLFTLANPDLLKRFSENLALLVHNVQRWLGDFSPQPTELLFCAAAAWIASGLLRPTLDRLLTGTTADRDLAPRAGEPVTAPSPLFTAYRNTLVVVILLFAAYLVFEFLTLWFREFPEGFYYSGYAHEGAAWLTVALALASAILSAIFRGRILHNSRLSQLRRLAWLWSLENMLLAVAVYHRLFIYIGFNGMTRMRTVGLYGISAVVVGFLAVLWKIARNHDFVWLVRRHLWTVALAVYLYSITPVDLLVMRYNVQRILGGDPAPCVQISVHPISSEGYLVLPPLVDCADPVIREGLKAMLADRLDEAELLAVKRQQDGWKAHQIAGEMLLERLRGAQGRWTEYSDPDLRAAKLKEFHAYAYRWF